MGIRVEQQPLGPQLVDFKGEWDNLLVHSSRPSVYSTFDYVYTACNCLKQNEKILLLFFSEEHSGDLLAVFPLSIRLEESFGVVSRVMTHATTTSFTDVDKPYPIIRKDREAVCWERFAAYLRDELDGWDMIDFDETEPDSYLHRALHRLFPFPRFCAKASPGPEYPLVRLDGAWERFWNAHPMVRRKTRKIEKNIGDRLSYTVTGQPEDMAPCIEQYISTERLGWKAGMGLSQPENEVFYRELLPRLAENGQAYFGILSDGDTIMSILIVYVYARQLYFVMCTYNPEYARWSPGEMNLIRMIEFFHGKGLLEGDFLSNGADYMRPLADRIGRTLDITIHRMDRKNAYLAMRGCIWKLKVRGRKLRFRLIRRLKARRVERKPERNSQ